MNGMHGQRPGGQGGGNDHHDLVAVFCGFAAAFLWANPLYQWTLESFRGVAINNYGYDALDVFEWAYWAFLHIIVFAITRVTVRWALVAIVSAVGYRLALSY